MIEQLEAMRAWALSNGFYDWVEQLNDVIDKLIVQKRDLEELREKHERLLIQIKE
jgi:hypothetical protein